jgi:MSHA biogenesis protein MshN
MGFGISLQEVQRVEDAKEAYRKALASHSLTPQLTAFVEQKLKAL